MKKLGVFLMLCTFVGLGIGCPRSTTNPDFASFEAVGPLQDEQTFGDYTVRTYELNESSFEILKKGVRVYADSGHRFEIGSIYETDKPQGQAGTNGTDITGDGHPNLVVSEWTGGAHCCFLFHVFQLGPHFRHIQTINAAHSDLADFENIDEEPDLEFLMADWTFAYWKASFAASPAPGVILKYDGEKYALACDLMRKPGLSPQDLTQLASDIKSWQGWEDYLPPSYLWGEMLDLIYMGNILQAWELFDRSWPEEIGGKEEFLKEFKVQLQESPFWESLQELNKESNRE